MLVDKDNSLWFIGRRNIGRLFADGRTELPDVEDETLGYVPEFTEIFEDREGRLWLTSSFFGVMGLRDTPVTRLSYSEGLSSPNVTAMSADRAGAVVVATDRGVDILVGDAVTSLFVEDLSAGRSIRSLYVDAQNRLWAGADNGLRLYSLDNGEQLVSPLVAGGIFVNDPVNDIAAGPNGATWIATNDGLIVVGPDGLVQRKPTSGARVRHLMFDKEGALWLATDKGIARFLEDSMQLIGDGSDHLTRPFSSLEMLPGGEIIGVTADHGLAIFDSDTWLRVGEANGIPAEQLIDVEVDGDRLWLITGSGVFRSTTLLGRGVGDALTVEPVATSKNYRSANTTSCCRGQGDAAALIVNNELFVATDDGVVTFALDVPLVDSEAARPYIKSVVSAGENLVYPMEGGYQLTWQENDLRINYSAIQLHGGSQVAFRYRLVGLSEEWVDNGKARSVQFQNLPPGNYTFELQASLQPNKWSESTGDITFTRQARFIESTAFRLLLWAAAIVATIFLVWARLAWARSRHKQLGSIIEERTNALRDLNAELQSANEQLKKSSQTDPLTGLVNRRFFDNVDADNRLNDTIANRGIVVVVDIDFFKRVNDAYGHAAGDDVLCQFANVLRSCVRKSDLIVRGGGEEFVGICRCPNDDPSLLLERICDVVRTHSFKIPDGNRISLTCSVGAIRYPIWQHISPNDRMPILMELADAALYEVKMTGRDGWALLEGGEVHYENPKSRYVGPRLGQLIDADNLRWKSSGASKPGLSLIDTQTRLRAIGSDYD